MEHGALESENKWYLLLPKNHETVSTWKHLEALLYLGLGLEIGRPFVLFCSAADLIHVPFVLPVKWKPVSSRIPPLSTLPSPPVLPGACGPS